MKVGIALRARYDVHVDVARAAEELGYESVWLPEHLIWPVDLGANSPHPDGRPAADPYVPTLDTLMWLVTLAQATTTLRLGTYVYNLALRSPFVAARAVQTLDIISGGRVEFGVGAGWSAGEYAAVGVDFASRGRRLDEAITVLRLLWTERTASHDGDFFSFGRVAFEPKPVQGSVAVLVGGESDAALRRAARLGDGWIGMVHDPQSARMRVEALRRLADDAKRPAVPVTVGGTPTNAAQLRAYAAAGVDRLLVSPWLRSDDAVRGLREFAPLLKEVPT